MLNIYIIVKDCIILRRKEYFTIITERINNRFAIGSLVIGMDFEVYLTSIFLRSILALLIEITILSILSIRIRLNVRIDIG